MRLKESQIEFIEQDLRDRGIVYHDLHEDMVDHICSAVEERMSNGASFGDAYHEALKPFTTRRLAKLERETTSSLNSFTMIKSYLTLTFRNLTKFPAFSAVNILGLAIGMAACFVMLQYVSYELAFDSFHPDADRTYRITMETRRGEGEPFHTASAYLPVAKVAQDALPEIVDYNRVYFLDRHAVVSYEDIKFEQEAVAYTDANFFKFFSYGLLQGKTDDVLKGVNSVAMSESAAKRYFGDTDPLGKVIRLTEEFNDLTLLVTGVYQDPPPNSHLKPKMVVSLSSIENFEAVKRNEWNWPFYMNYIRLREDARPLAVESKLQSVVGTYFDEDEKQSVLHLQPLRDIHLRSSLEFEMEPNGSINMVLLLLGVALLTLVIAYSNYVNLSTARSLDRAREVGIRKALGSRKKTLISQFLTEAMTINLIALLVSILISFLFMWLLRSYAGVDLDFLGYTGSWFWIALVFLFIVGSVLSSFYPALVLSSFQPIAALRGKLTGNLSGQSLRRVLVIFQFVASISLMIGAYAIYSQLDFMQNQSLGMSIDKLLVVKGPRVTDVESTPSNDPFVILTLGNQEVANVSITNSVPGIWTSSAQGITRQGSDVGKDDFFSIVSVDSRFMNTYGVELVAGRNFEEASDSRLRAVILNEEAVQHLGFESKEAAIGSRIEFRGMPINIVGVIRNYHHFSLKSGIEPMLLHLIDDGNKEYYTIQFDQINNEVIADLEHQWQSVYPDNPFEYFFLSHSFAAQYESDVKFRKMFTSFSLLATFIACLGLYGLASFVTQKRIREIGIRKVLGSSVTQIIVLLLKDFGKLIAISGVVAIPIAVKAIQNWQAGFAFKVDLAWWVYGLPVIAVLFIAIVTVSFHTIKAALTNPVNILKYD
ncbi:MAG: ABC transporter permease [Cyclobacteriaceae bacterium]|nr:ABC transporter permease [Cyclobacteriaceae bacterium]